MIQEKYIGEYLLSGNRDKIDIAYVHDYLSKRSYWAKNISLQIVEQSVKGSLCFGIYLKDKQVGFARVITDEATFAYLADVFIDESHRGKGLSKELMRFIMECDFAKVIRNFMLATLDAHGLYSQFGFKPMAEPERFMAIKFFKEY